MRNLISTTLIIPTLLLLACGQPTPPVSSTTTTETSSSPTMAEETVTIVVLGNSIAAGLGLAESNAFPAVLEQLLRDEGHSVRVVNAGVSGDTSAGGLRRVDWILKQQPEVVVVELGGNDALRGQPLESTETNLRGITRQCREAGAHVVLLGMDVPTNYGPDYAGAFAELYERLAAEQQVALVPGFMREVGLNERLMQPDGLHPTAEGQRVLALRLVPHLTSLVGDISRAKSTNEEE